LAAVGYCVLVLSRVFGVIVPGLIYGSGIQSFSFPARFCGCHFLRFLLRDIRIDHDVSGFWVYWTVNGEPFCIYLVETIGFLQDVDCLPNCVSSDFVI
jgi:hypothetical protein